MLCNYHGKYTDVAHGNAIPSENDVCRQTFLCVSLQPLIPQKIPLISPESE